MGQRDGFAKSDLMKINKMYNCDSSSYGAGGGGGGGAVIPGNNKPNRPGMQGFGSFVSGLGQFISALGGKHDENEIHH